MDYVYEGFDNIDDRVFVCSVICLSYAWRSIDSESTDRSGTDTDVGNRIGNKI